MIYKTNKSKVFIKGQHLASFYDMRDKRAIAIEREIEHHIISKPSLILPTGWQRFFVTEKQKSELFKLYKQQKAEHRKTYLEMIAELKRLFMVRECLVDNLIATTGRAVLMQRLANDTTYTGVINYGALGTDATAPTNGDTTLTTEVFRKVVASASDTDNVAFIDFFYSKADTNGTYEEFGTVIDGAAGADTGQLFTHALTGSWVKTASESMTVACQYTAT